MTARHSHSLARRSVCPCSAPRRSGCSSRPASIEIVLARYDRMAAWRCTSGSSNAHVRFCSSSEADISVRSDFDAICSALSRNASSDHAADSRSRTNSVSCPCTRPDLRAARAQCRARTWFRRRPPHCGARAWAGWSSGVGAARCQLFLWRAPVRVSRPGGVAAPGPLTPLRPTPLPAAAPGAPPPQVRRTVGGMCAARRGGARAHGDAQGGQGRPQRRRSPATWLAGRPAAGPVRTRSAGALAAQGRATGRPTPSPPSAYDRPAPWQARRWPLFGQGLPRPAWPPQPPLAPPFFAPGPHRAAHGPSSLHPASLAPPAPLRARA